MPQLYTAVAGDTLESVALHFYQDESKAEILGVINAVTDLQPGQMLTIPAL